MAIFIAIIVTNPVTTRIIPIIIAIKDQIAAKLPVQLRKPQDAIPPIKQINPTITMPIPTPRTFFLSTLVFDLPI